MSTLILAFVMKGFFCFLKTDRRTGKKIRAASRQKAALWCKSHFQTFIVSAADFSGCVNHFSALAHHLRIERGLSILPSGWNGKSQSVLSSVFPWQWGHVVCLTTDLGTEARWFGSLGGSVEPKWRERWRREKMRGGLWLHAHTAHTVQYVLKRRDVNVDKQQ